MKKLLLASNGPYLINHGYKFLGIPAGDINIGYVTTASKGAYDTTYIQKQKEAMKDYGYRFEEIDIEGKSEQELRDFFAAKNIIHVEGGNAFYLLKIIRETGFDSLLKEFINAGMIYCGTSAGAYICCPTIETAAWGPKHREQYGLNDLSALNLVPFLLKAHYTDEMKSLFSEKIRQSTYPVRLLRDGQAIYVEDATYTFVGDGVEEILNS